MSRCSVNRIDAHTAYLLWLIDESVEELLGRLALTDLEQLAYSQLTHPGRRLAWLAARVALQELGQEFNCPYTGVHKDTWGRPYLAGSKFYVSLSHCFPYALAAIAKQAPIGIDIQWPHKKLQKVQAKFLNGREIKDSAHDVEKLGIYWCAKEAIYKAYGGVGVSLRQDISIEPFVKNSQGTVQGRVASKRYEVHYSFYRGHVLAWCQAAKQVIGPNE